VRIPLPLRIFSIHLVFMLALGALGAALVGRAFDRYEQAWMAEIETLPAERLFSPLAGELARSLLLKLEQGPSEPQERVKSSVAAGLDRVFPSMPSIDRLLILDADLGMKYANEASELELSFAEQSYESLLGSEEPVRRELLLRSGDRVTEVMLPIYERNEETGQSERLGSVVVHYRADPRLARQLIDTHIESEIDETGTQPFERLFTPWAGEVARALLREQTVEPAAEAHAFQVGISDGLNKLIGALPMETLVIVDDERRIQYINDPQYLDLAYTGGENASLFASIMPVRRPVTLNSGEPGMEIMFPVFDAGPAAAGDAAGRRRLGSLLIRYRPDPELLDRLPIAIPEVGPADYLQPLVLFLVLAVASGTMLAALTGLPVRRLEAAMDDFRKRGFRGGLDPGKAVPSYLAPTVETISEMGGQLEALDAQGREREALLETLSQSLEDGMIAVDPSGVPVAWNPAAVRLLCGPRESDGASDEAGLLQEAIASDADLSFVLNQVEGAVVREVTLNDSSGAGSPARVTRVPLELRPGVTGTLLFIRDLAALRQVEGHLLDAGRFAGLAHLAAGLAHEIRNPLHAIQINASVVQQYAGADATTELGTQAVGDSLKTIQDEAQRLTDLLNNYLGMVRASDDTGPVDLREQGRKVLQLVDFAARKSNIEIRLEGLEHPPPVYGVANRLQQAILNLVLNAIQAMPDGGVLKLEIAASGGVVRLTVSDTGPGLPQELADQLFDTRVTTKAGGTGLGLPLVKMITEAHGGGVWYRSSPGQGAAFTLMLPVQEETVRA